MKKRDLTPKQIHRRIRLIRSAMKLLAGQMVDLDRAVGTVQTFPTDKGPVRALTYGWDRPDVTPLLFNIHGSGFVMGSAAMDDPFMMQFVEKCGVKVISIDYPLAPEAMFPVAVNQCRALMQYVRAHAQELRIDPDRMMIMGHSAGGNFCASIGLMENDHNTLGLKGIILDYPPTDISADPCDKPRPRGCLPPALSRIFDAAYCRPEERSHPLVSPALATEEMVQKFPPVLVITAGQDSLAAETERFGDTLFRAGVQVQSKRFEGAIHGFTIITEKQGRRFPAVYEQSLNAWQMMIDFVNQHI